MQARKRVAWTESLAYRPLRVVWGLLAGLGLTAEGMLLLPAAAQAAPPRTQQAALTAEAVQVQLAWLADPMTFPCPLAARMTPSGLLVQGYVPTPAVRQRALQVVQATYRGPLVDRLQVQSGMSLRLVTPQPAAKLQAAAEELLRKRLGETSVRVQAQDNGTLVVYGGVASSEEKCRVGQIFRSLEGCRAVVTRLDTRPGMAVATRPAPSKAATPAPKTPAPLPASITGTTTASCASCASCPQKTPTRVAKSLSLEALPPIPSDGLPIVRNGTGTGRTSKAGSKEAPWVATAPAAKVLVQKTPAPTPPAPADEQVIVLASFSKRAGSDGKVTDSDPRVTTGLVTLPSSVLCARDEVRQAIEAACGSTASGVCVDVKGRRELHVRLKVRRLEEWPALRARLAALPQLALYAVSFDAQPAR